jgi:hypothetical protein
LSAAANDLAPGFYTAEIFLKNATSGLGGASRIINLRVSHPIVLSAAATANGMDLRFENEPGRKYYIETSEDLLQWSPLETYTATSVGTSNRSFSRTGSQMFFRVRTE